MKERDMGDFYTKEPQLMFKDKNEFTGFYDIMNQTVHELLDNNYDRLMVAARVSMMTHLLWQHMPNPDKGDRSAQYQFYLEMMDMATRETEETI